MSAPVEATLLAMGVAPVGAMPMALLPVAGKPILAHCIDALRALGVTRLTILTAFPRAIRAAAGALPLYEMDWRVDGGPWVSRRRERTLLLSADLLSGPGIPLDGDSVICAPDGRIVAASVPAGRVLPRARFPARPARSRPRCPERRFRRAARAGVAGRARHPSRIPRLGPSGQQTARGSTPPRGSPARSSAPGRGSARMCRSTAASCRPAARVPTGSRLAEAFVMPCGAVLRAPRAGASMRRAA